MMRTFTSISEVTLSFTGRVSLNIKVTLKWHTSLKSPGPVEKDGI